MCRKRMFSAQREEGGKIFCGGCGNVGFRYKSRGMRGRAKSVARLKKHERICSAFLPKANK